MNLSAGHTCHFTHWQPAVVRLSCVGNPYASAAEDVVHGAALKCCPAVPLCNMLTSQRSMPGIWMCRIAA